MRTWSTLAVFALCGCGALPVAHRDEGAALSEVDMTFTVAPDLGSIAVHLCARGQIPLVRLRAVHAALFDRISEVRVDGREATWPPRSALELQGARCVEYRARIETGFSTIETPWSFQVEGARVVSTGLFASAPEPRDGSTRLRARFAMPEDMEHSQLGPPGDGPWMEVDERLFRHLTVVALGRLSRSSVNVARSTIEVVAFPGVEMPPAEQDEWVRRAAEAISSIHGRFPRERTNVVLVPTAGGSGGVAFGLANRGVVPTITLFVDPDIALARAMHDWTLVHEFAHLAAPFVPRASAWMTEGLATYYQEVARARVGLISREQAIRNLESGFARGARSGTGRTLEQEAASMGRTGEFARIYWAGAAIALLADIQYRDAGASLDIALRRTERALDDTLPPEQLARMIDGEGTSVMTRLIAEWLPQTEFPDVREAMARAVADPEWPGSDEMPTP